MSALTLRAADEWKCPHCKNSTRQNVQSFFLSIHRNKPVTCTQCEKEFTIHVELRPFVEAVEHGVQAAKGAKARELSPT